MEPTFPPKRPWSLSDADRWKLYDRMSFTTPGIYIKTGFFTIRDQIRDAPAGWPQNAEGFGNRLGNRYAQFLMQNSFTAMGDAMAGWEPRYDRCRNCDGVGQRIKHTIVRNFVTYGNDENFCDRRYSCTRPHSAGRHSRLIGSPTNPTRS